MCKTALAFGACQYQTVKRICKNLSVHTSNEEDATMSMIKTMLKEFKLSAIYNSYEERIKYAQDKNLSYEKFLEMLT